MCRSQCRPKTERSPRAAATLWWRMDPSTRAREWGLEGAAKKKEKKSEREHNEKEPQGWCAR